MSQRETGIHNRDRLWSGACGDGWRSQCCAHQNIFLAELTTHKSVKMSFGDCIEKQVDRQLVDVGQELGTFMLGSTVVVVFEEIRKW